MACPESRRLQLSKPMERVLLAMSYGIRLNVHPGGFYFLSSGKSYSERFPPGVTIKALLRRGLVGRFDRAPGFGLSRLGRRTAKAIRRAEA